MPRAVRETDVLQSLLTDRGWTQRDLAERLHVDEKTVSRWMTGATNLTERRLRRVFAQLTIDPAPYGLEPIATPPADAEAAPAWAVAQHAEQMKAIREMRDLLEHLIATR